MGGLSGVRLVLRSPEHAVVGERGVRRAVELRQGGSAGRVAHRQGVRVVQAHVCVSIVARALLWDIERCSRVVAVKLVCDEGLCDLGDSVCDEGLSDLGDIRRFMDLNCGSLHYSSLHFLLFRDFPRIVVRAVCLDLVFESAASVSIIIKASA